MTAAPFRPGTCRLCGHDLLVGFDGNPSHADRAKPSTMGSRCRCGCSMPLR